MHLASKKGLVDDEPKADNAVATYGDTGTARSPAAVRENEHALTSPPPPPPPFFVYQWEICTSFGIDLSVVTIRW